MRTKESKFKVSRLDYIEPVEAWKKFESYSNVIFLDSAGEQSENTAILILQLVHYVILKLKTKNYTKMILKLKMK